ncbi:uncharacterized protein DNG_09924 [Cephalotrichum gorgonifer]|uniref:Tyrosinase copper-binding domain-containing protein n=1 Tax=Cephalotrichum gorgonifer TaxID=2041049 RepID=A0AAE8SZV3_9PEZI|nr:uncharacterized protein DNG_09924 [Cephalotrichum gorgonifer]
MAPLRMLLTLAAAATSAAKCNPSPPAKQCKTKSQRQAWHTYTDEQKRAYIDAELCLMNKPATLGLSAAKNRFEELQAVHVLQSGITHGVGAFLPFHRLHMHAHELLLKTECGYGGTQPYWDVTHDVGNLAGSAILNPDTGFGGDGVGEDRCIQDGPFASFINSLGPGYSITDHCITRRLNETYHAMGGQEYINACYRRSDFDTAEPCLEGAPHIAGHSAIGGIMNDPIASPGDPIFYLHHTWLDKVFWDWQAQDLPSRLTEIGLSNTFKVFDPTTGPPPLPEPQPGDPPIISVLPDAFPAPEDLVPPPDAPPQIPRGDGDGDITTLNHVLQMLGVIPDATIAEGMDIAGGLLCYEYV